VSQSCCIHVALSVWHHLAVAVFTSIEWSSVNACKTCIWGSHLMASHGGLHWGYQRSACYAAEINVIEGVKLKLVPLQELTLCCKHFTCMSRMSMLPEISFAHLQQLTAHDFQHVSRMLYTITNLQRLLHLQTLLAQSWGSLQQTFIVSWLHVLVAWNSSNTALGLLCSWVSYKIVELKGFKGLKGLGRLLAMLLGWLICLNSLHAM